METRIPDAPVSSPEPDEARFERAKRRLAAIKGFYVHLFVFAVVNAGLFVVNVATGQPWWVHWVLLGWGIGVLAHALAVFGRAPQAIAEWEKRKLRQLVNER